MILAKDIKKLKLESKIEKPAILNLCNYGDNQIDFFKQSENLARGYLFKDEGEEYGYYVITHDTRRENDVLASVSLGILPFHLLGLPASFSHFALNAKLYIFDSQGELLKEYENTSDFKHVAGLYYGHKPQKKLEKKYSELYDEIFEVVASQASEINSDLKQAGHISIENMKTARQNIEAFFKTRGETYKKNYGQTVKLPDAMHDQADNLPPKPAKKPLAISDFNQGLEIGKYHCVQYKNLTIQMLFGIFTLLDGNKTVAVGSYSRHGNKLVVSFYEGEIKGQTNTYIIDDSKHFHHIVDNENWVHESIYKD